ncbi:MAG: ribosome assembly factor SBDS [Thermoprotei archaeon]|nr:MAG: ribosome assembly factor SBDS [Thermoprotei archaeon]
MSSRKYTIARYEAQGERFEILVDPDRALELKLGKSVSIDKVLISDTVYKDAKKGLRASEASLRKVFGTTDVRKIAETIIKKGELLLTAEQRKKMIEEKKRQIIEFIHRNCIDPRTNLPHPVMRIEMALEQSGAPIDPFKSVEEQIPTILKYLQKILPIRMAKAIVGIKIPPQFVSKAYGYVAKVGKILRSNYQTDGTWIAEVEIPAGLQETLISKINEITKGQGEVKIISVK